MPIPLTGRTTSKSCRQPVSYARHGTALPAPGRDQRKLNLQESRPQCIQLRGHLPRPGRGQEGTGADPLTRSPVGRSGSRCTPRRLTLCRGWQSRSETVLRPEWALCVLGWRCWPMLRRQPSRIRWPRHCCNGLTLSCWPAGAALFDHDSFDVTGAWKLDRGDQFFGYEGGGTSTVTHDRSRWAELLGWSIAARDGICRSSAGLLPGWPLPGCASVLDAGRGFGVSVRGVHAGGL